VVGNVKIEKYLEEGVKYLERNDSVQASEKLYKAAEEAVKVLASASLYPSIRKLRVRVDGQPSCYSAL
jgi:Tfp pilus assembly protein PilF